MNEYVRRNFDAFGAIVVLLFILMLIIPASFFSNLLGMVIGGGIVYLLYVNKYLDKL